MKTTDGGATWTVLASDFGGPDGPETIHALAFDAPRNRVLATGSTVLAESRDEGASWEIMDGDWQGFGHPQSALAVHPQNGDAWYGGQNAIEGLILHHFQHATRTSTLHLDVLPRPSVAKGIGFPKAQDPKHVIITGEGGIAETRDAGLTWTKLFGDGFNFYFDIALDASSPSRMVSARWQKYFDSPQPLHAIVSDDAGKTWRVISDASPNVFGGAWSIYAIRENGRTNYLLGLYKGGVVRLEL
jgi:hypothetical protein